MKRSLIVFRHGKSDWSSGAQEDHERELARRGVSAARAMGEHLARLGETPELVLCSTATRARRTAELAIDAGGWDCDLRLDDRLYLGGVGQVLEVLAELDPRVTRVVVTGHEPTSSGLVEALCGVAPDKFPTCAMARIELPARGWQELEGNGELRWLTKPRQLSRER